MAARGDLLDQPGMAFGHPAENEEGRLDVQLIEEVEDALRVSFNAARKA